MLDPVAQIGLVTELRVSRSRDDESGGHRKTRVDQLTEIGTLATGFGDIRTRQL